MADQPGAEHPLDTTDPPLDHSMQAMQYLVAAVAAVAAVLLAVMR